MKIQGLYAAVYVRDIKPASVFYAKVLGREPDDRPNDKLVQWRGFGSAGIQLFADKSKAGQGIMTLVVPDLEKVTSKLASDGIKTDKVISGDFGKVTHVIDPDGNTITLAEPPRQ